MSLTEVPLDTVQAKVPYAFVGGPFGSNLTAKDYLDDGVPVIRGGNLSADGWFIDDNFVFVSETKADSLRSNTAHAGDLIFTQRGTLGQVGRIPDEPKFPRYIISQSQMKLTVDPDIADSRFIYYYFRQPSIVQEVINRAITSGVPHINLGILRSFKVTLPPVKRQRKAADVLCAYDELIENNLRRMQLLEDAARQLYHEWFVRLRFPGCEHTRITDGVPEGWARRQLNECASFQSGGTPSKARAEYWEGDIPWVSSGELTSMRLHRTKLNVTSEAVDAGSRMVPPETILAVVRGMSLAKEFRIGVTAGAMSFNQDLKAIVAKREIDALLLFHALDAQRERIRERATEASHGTKKLDTAVLSEVPIMVPPKFLQRLFRENVEPMHAQWDNLDQQNQKLRTARDLLLPRLMSGELAF